MSMTFWAHTQVDGKISTDHVDRSYIYTFLDQLDTLCRQQQFVEISELCDYSDSLAAIVKDMDEFDDFDDFDEIQDKDPDNLDEVTWMAAHDARDLLIYLLNALENDPAVLDIEEDEYDGLCDEIRGCLDLVDAALDHDADALFNLTLIM